MKFYKYHGLGNDYIVIDYNHLKLSLDQEQIKAICDRNFGVGADGILLGPINKNNFVKIYNSDGSEAEKSGNGLRIFAQFLLDEKYVTTNEFRLETISGFVYAKTIDNNIELEMGNYSFKTKDIPALLEVEEIIEEQREYLNNNYFLNCINVGNPHCSIIVAKTSEKLAKNIGPIIESDKIFPNKINVQFVEIIDDSNIKIEIWERGSGYTLASGSSATASFLVANRLKLVSNKVNVIMPGGVLVVEKKDNKVFLTGPVEKVFTGEISEKTLVKNRRDEYGKKV